MNVSVLINLHNQKLNIPASLLSNTASCLQKTEFYQNSKNFEDKALLYAPKVFKTFGFEKEEKQGYSNCTTLCFFAKRSEAKQTRGVATDVTTSKSELSAGFANSKEKVQDKVGRNLNKKTFVYQYLLSRLLKGSYTLKNSSSCLLQKASIFKDKATLFEEKKGYSNSVTEHNNTFTSFAAASLFIPKVENGKLKDGQIALFGIHDVRRDQVRNFFPYRKSFLCYWLFPFVGFVFTLGLQKTSFYQNSKNFEDNNGEIQNTNNTSNYTFNLNSVSASPFAKKNFISYNIPNKSSKQIEDASFLYKKFKEDFYNSFKNSNSSALRLKNEGFFKELREEVHGEKNQALNPYTSSAFSNSPFFFGKEENSNCLKNNDKLYQQCSLYLQSLENYLNLNTNLNELENSLKISLLNKDKFNKADITITNNKLLLENISSRLTNTGVKSPSTASAISLRSNSTGDSSRHATVQENYKPFLLKKPFWYEVPYPYFTSINSYEGSKGSEKSGTYFDSSLYTFVSNEKTRKNSTFPYIFKKQSFFLNIFDIQQNPSGYQKSKIVKKQSFLKELKETSKFPLKLMVWGSALPEGQNKPTYDSLGKNSIGFLKNPFVLKKGGLHSKENKSPTGFQDKQTTFDFLSTYSNVNPISSYLKASVILDNYAKNKALLYAPSVFKTFGYQKKQKVFFEERENKTDKFLSRFFANGEYDSFIETNLNLSSTSFLFAPFSLSSHNERREAQKSEHSIVSSILSNSKELNQKKFEGIWTEFLKTVTKNHIKTNQESLKDFKEQSSISILNKNTKIVKKLSKETLYKLLFASLEKSFFSLAEDKESMQINDTVKFTEIGFSQRENKNNNINIKLSHPILMSAPVDVYKPVSENVREAKESDKISNKTQIKDFTFTRNALTGFSIDNSKLKETSKEIKAMRSFALLRTKGARTKLEAKQNKFNKKLNINEYLQYSTFIKKYAENVKNVLLKSRFKESSDILSNKGQSTSAASYNEGFQKTVGFMNKRSLACAFGAGKRPVQSEAIQGVYTYNESARMEKLLRAYFSIKKGKVPGKYSPVFMKKNTLNVLKWTSRLKTKINKKFIEKNPIIFLNNDHPTISFKQNKEALQKTSALTDKNRSFVKLQGTEIVRQFNDVYKHKFSPRLLIKNRSFIINNRFISSNIKEKGISPLSRFSMGVVIKPSSYFLEEKKLESYLSKTFGFANKLNNSQIISKANFEKYNDITKLKQEEHLYRADPSVFVSTLAQLENNRISLKKWDVLHADDKVDMSLETKRKYTQKKRRRKKLKKETRRRKKRKRFYPRPNWIRYRLYLNFLKKRYDKNSKTYHNTFSFYKGSLHKSYQNEKGISYSKEFSKEGNDLKLTNNRPYIVLKNKETFADSSLVSLNPSKENFTISRVVLGDFKRVLWKSYWLRSNLNPYLKRVKTYLTEIKESTQKWEFFRNVNNFVNFLGGFISPFSPLELPAELYQRFTKAKQRTSQNSLGFQDFNSQLGEFDFGIFEQKHNPFENYMNFSKWEKSLYLSEYNRITYQRIQEFISQIRENFAAIQGSSEGMGAFGRNVKGKSRSASSATHISHLNLQDNKREAVLSKRKSTDFWVKLGKTLMAESYAQSTLLKKSWLFKEPTLPQLRMYWAFSKTSYGSFKDFNKRKETWTVGKTREQTKYNKTKKIYRDLSLKLQTLLNEQYELWTSEKLALANGFTPEFEKGDQVKQEIDSTLSAFSKARPLAVSEADLPQPIQRIGVAVFKDALKKARLKEEKSTFLFNKSVSNNKYKYENLNALTLHQYKKNIQLRSALLALPTVQNANSFKPMHATSRFNSPLTISPAPSAWSTKLTNKSSYWWSDALTAKGFMPLELSQLQFLNKTETSGSLINSESYLPPSQVFTHFSLPSFMFQRTYKSEDVKGAKKAVNSLLDFGASYTKDASNTKALKISALLFHFCSIISLISISQIRDLLKFYFLGISKIYKSSIGILGFSFDLFSSKEITSSFGKGTSGLNKIKKQHFFNTKKLNSFSAFGKRTVSPAELQEKLTNKRSNISKNRRPYAPLVFKTESFERKAKQTKRQINSLQFLNKVNSLIQKSFNLHSTSMLLGKSNKEISDLQAYNLLSKDARVKEAQTISLNYQKSSPYINVKELKTLSKNKTSFLKTYTTLYSLIFINFLLENLNGFYFKTNRLFKQTFDIFGRFGPRSLFNFLEKPGELIGDWIAYMFLVEWASDMTNTIPENVDVYLGTTTLKATRTLHGVNLLSIYQNLLVLLQNSKNFDKAKLFDKSSLFDMESFIKNVSILNIGSTFIQRRIYHLYEILLQRFYQPDTDLIVRQKKGVIFWDIWGDFLMQVAEDSNINISELTSLKEEQIKLFEKAQESLTSESPKTENFSFDALFKSSLKLQNNQSEMSFLQKPKVYQKSTIFEDKTTRFLKGVKGFKSFVPLFNKNIMSSKKGFALLDKGVTPSTLPTGLVQAFFSPSPKDKNRGAKQSSIVVSKSFYTAKLFQAQQFLSYQGKDTELFIDLHPPKSFSMVSFLKRNESVQHPIGSLVCQIFSGIMTKQISKNILVVGPGSSIGRDGGVEKTLLIQAIAGETELKIITDNAYRYAMVYRGVAVGIKLLRDVFDSLALHTPCLFLIEDIHAIGERRPLLISDDENTKGAESNSFGSQREEIHEKNQVLYQLNKHVITHYRKPYKGDFSMLIPTNHFCFDLFRRNTGFAGNYPSKKQNLSFNAPRISIKSEKDQSNDSQMSNNSLSTHATVPSRLLVKSSQLFAPPATSPFSVLTLKEEKKFKPYKIVSEMPWGGLPGEQLAQVSKSSYSVRVKVALLADMAISTLSVKLDMITDLLVIIDSVKGNRGFVVFATTHVPYILDPALRRPGRLDETITLGLFPSILSRWEILKSSFGLFTAGKEQTGFNKGLSLDLTYSITFGHHPNRPSLFSNSAGWSEGASSNAEGNSLSKRMKQNNSSFAEGELTQFENNILLLASKVHKNTKYKLTSNKAQAHNSSLIHSQAIANKLLPSRFYSRSASFPSLLFLNSSETVIKNRKIKKEILNINKIERKRNIYSIFNISNSSLPISNKHTSSYKGIKADFYSNQEIAYRMSFGDSERRSAEFFGYPKEIQIMQQKQKAPFDVNKILSQTYFYASLLLYEASINIKNSPQFLDTPSSLFVTNQTTPLSLYASLYASPQQFKAFIVNFISGKLGETLLFSGIRPASFVTQNKEAINGFNSTPSSPKVKGVGVYTSYGLSSTWKALSSLVISFVQKRFLYHSNLIVPKFLYFNNQSSLLEPPSPPSSNILLPARRYENYKRSFSVFSGQQISKKVGIMDKIQAHQQQRLIKRLYGFPVQELFRSEVMENRSTSFSNASLMIGSFSSILQKPSNSNWFVKNRILMRHKNYLTNQWWNGQLSEHNAETTFLSDIDWRSTFVESIGDLILDFPDADQHYNPRNRRWLLTKGSYHNWFDFDKTIYSEIYSHFIFDSFVKAYYIYEQNREVLDFYAYSVLKNGLHNVLNEFSILKLYKRFGTLSKPTLP